MSEWWDDWMQFVRKWLYVGTFKRIEHLSVFNSSWNYRSVELKCIQIQLMINCSISHWPSCRSPRSTQQIIRLTDVTSVKSSRPRHTFHLRMLNPFRTIKIAIQSIYPQFELWRWLNDDYDDGLFPLNIMTFWVNTPNVTGVRLEHQQQQSLNGCVSRFFLSCVLRLWWRRWWWCWWWWPLNPKS